MWRELTISKKQFEGADRRASRREATKCVVLCYFDKNNWGRLLDISEGGMLLECGHLPPLRQQISFAFEAMGCATAQLPERVFDKSFVTTGEVLWTREFQRRAGVRFVDLAEERLQQIRQWLAMETAGTVSVEEETRGSEALQDALAPLASVSETSSEANGDASQECLELSASDGEPHLALAPPVSEETLEVPETTPDDTLSVESQAESEIAAPVSHIRRTTLIGVSSGVAVLALVASAKIIGSRQAPAASASVQRANAAAASGKPDGEIANQEIAGPGTGSPLAASPRPFTVEVLDANNKHWTLSFVPDRSKDESSGVSSGSRRAAFSPPLSERDSGKKQPPPSAKAREPGEIALPSPQVNQASAASAKDDLVAPAFAGAVAKPTDGLVVAILAGGAPPVPVEPTPAPALAVGGAVEQPRVIKSVLPKYPPAGDSINASGDVTLDALIDVHGNVTEVKAISGPAVLRFAAQDALRQWKYEPARLNGHPIAVHLTVTMKFRVP